MKQEKPRTSQGTPIQKEPTVFDIAELETVWKSGGLLKPDEHKDTK